MKSLSPMETNPPILPISPPPSNPSPIVGQVLGFDSMDDTTPLQPCSHLRLEDTCSADTRPNSADCMVDVLESQGLGTFEDPTELEAALHNSSLNVCKDVLPRRGSSDDDDEDRGQDRQEGGGMGDHVHVTTVNSIGALNNPLSNSGRISGDSGDKPLADKEGRMEDDLVDYESDPYEWAIHDQVVAIDFVSCGQSHSQDLYSSGQGIFPTLPLILCWLLFFLLGFFPRGEDTCFCFAISIICLIFIISMSSIVPHQELVVWMSLHQVLSLS